MVERGGHGRHPHGRRQPRTRRGAQKAPNLLVRVFEFHAHRMFEKRVERLISKGKGLVENVVHERVALVVDAHGHLAHRLGQGGRRRVDDVFAHSPCGVGIRIGDALRLLLECRQRIFDKLYLNRVALLVQDANVGHTDHGRVRRHDAIDNRQLIVLLAQQRRQVDGPAARVGVDNHPIDGRACPLRLREELDIVCHLNLLASQLLVHVDRKVDGHLDRLAVVQLVRHAHLASRHGKVGGPRGGCRIDGTARAQKQLCKLRLRLRGQKFEYGTLARRVCLGHRLVHAAKALAKVRLGACRRLHFSHNFTTMAFYQPCCNLLLIPKRRPFGVSAFSSHITLFQNGV